MLELLLGNVSRFEAEDQERMIQAALAPWMKPGDLRVLLSQLARYTHSIEPHEPMQIIEYSPEKAREWFETQGAIVQ